jgi:uncharacterized DUF497 family protein
VDITFDPAKREATLQQRGLDFADAAIVFQGDYRSFEDARRDYGEIRLISYGRLWPDGRNRLDAARRSPPRYFDEES